MALLFKTQSALLKVCLDTAVVVIDGMTILMRGRGIEGTGYY
jgi:hypothetical protein